MSDETYRIWCFVEGDSTVFDVVSSPSETVSNLRRSIKETCKNSSLKNVDAKELTLRKVDIVLSKDIVQKDFTGKDIPGSVLLGIGFEKISDYWRAPPSPTHLHIIVEPPPACAIPRWSTHLDDDQRPGKRARFSEPLDEGNTASGSMSPQVTDLLHTPPKVQEKLENSIRETLQRYRPAMRTLVTKAGLEPLLPLWVPETGIVETAFKNHIKTLGIPSVRGMPSLLLHDLGSESSIISQKQAIYISKIFSLHNHIVLINTSGSGKTRLGLHGLCQNWGFYGVVKQAEDDIGSEDFWQLMSSLDNYHYNSAKARGIHDDAAARHMHDKVHHRVLQFLLARFLLLNLLITEASKCEGGLRPSDHRFLWVLLQARPTDLLKEDAFAVLANDLRRASVVFLKDEIKNEYLKLKDILEFVNEPLTGRPTRRPLYCFLDEIQVTTTSRMGEFLSEDKKKERPLLRPIWQSVTGVLKTTEMLVILSGTSINESSLVDVLQSSILKFHRYIIVRDIGAFDDPDSQMQYIERYLLSSQSTTWQYFLKRAWGWCRGRYRSTATLITLVLAAGPYSPHKILNNFVEKFTKFLPTDGEEWCNKEPDVNDLYMGHMKGWDFDRLERRQIDVLRDILYGQIVYGSYTLTPFEPNDDIKAFIEYGFARTKIGKNVIDEPLAIMAMWNWFSEKGHFSLLHRLQRDVDKHAPRKNGFEAYLAFYLHKVFENGARLNDVFAFRSDFARRKHMDLSWQNEKFELVTVSTPVGTNQQKVSAVTPSRGPSSNVALLATTDNDVLDWISQNKECYAFCFPTESAGPDFFFYLRNTETKRLLLVVLQAKHYGDVDKPTLIQGVRTVTPSFFWKRRNEKPVDEVSNQALVVASHFCDALMKIEHSISINNADYPVLRIFASYPADAKLDRTQDVNESKGQGVDEDDVDVTDPDPHPLATLRLDNFEENSKMFAKSWYRNDTEQKVVFSAQDQYEVELRRSRRITGQSAGTMA